jgi:hypothetical protein
MGCPLGSLSTELGKCSADDLHPQAAPLLTGLLEWLRAQFARSCTAEDAMRHAEHVLACLQGAAVVAQASRDPGVVTRQVDGLRRWMDREVFVSECAGIATSDPKPTSDKARIGRSKQSKPQ